MFLGPETWSQNEGESIPVALPAERCAQVIPAPELSTFNSAAREDGICLTSGKRPHTV